MIPEVKPDVFLSIGKTMEEKGPGWFLEQFAMEQPSLSIALFDNEDAKITPVIMIYFGIKSQMEADALK